MRYVRLFSLSFSLAARRELAHRGNLVFSFFVTAIGTAAAAGAVGAVFLRVDSLAGWTAPQALVLLGTFTLADTARRTVFEPSLGWFLGTMVREGGLDDLLLRPASSLFSATTRAFDPLGLVQMLFGVVLVAWGGALAGAAAAHVPAYALLLVCGVVVTWAARTLLACGAFWDWTDPTVSFFSMWQLGRYPVEIYPRPVRVALSSVIPVVFVAAVPARVLTRGPSATLMLSGIAASVVAVVVTRAAWHAGLRRYGSATS